MKGRGLAAGFLLCAALCFGGDNRWTSAGPFGGYFLTFANDPQSANTVYVSGGDSMFRSRTGGQVWERLDISGTTSFPAAFTMRFTPGATNRMLAAGTSVFATTNQGSNWEQLAFNPAGGDQINDLEFHPSNAQILYAISYRHGFLRSNDGGRTWALKNSGLNVNPRAACCDLPQVEVDPTNGNTVYALLSSRILYKSTNGGDSWKATPLKFTSPVNSLVLDPKSPQVLYAGGFDGIFKTTNGGTTWATTNCSCGIFSMAMDPRNTQTLYAVSDTAIKTTNGGAVWAELPAPIPQGGSWLGVSVSNKGVVFAGGFGTGVFRSLDGGHELARIHQPAGRTVHRTCGIKRAKAFTAFRHQSSAGVLFRERRDLMDADQIAQPRCAIAGRASNRIQSRCSGRRFRGFCHQPGWRQNVGISRTLPRCARVLHGLREVQPAGFQHHLPRAGRRRHGAIRGPRSNVGRHQLGPDR